VPRAGISERLEFAALFATTTLQRIVTYRRLQDQFLEISPTSLRFALLTRISWAGSQFTNADRTAETGDSV
jgi:hypothetical protein